MPKVDRSAFLYENPKPPVDRFAQCSTCEMFISGARKCAIHDPSVTIYPDSSCGLYVHGKPQGAGKAVKRVTPKESGLVHRPVRCEHCAFFDGTCGLYEKLNRENPETFDLNPKVHPKGCCNANTARPKPEKRATGGRVGYADGGDADDWVTPASTQGTDDWVTPAPSTEPPADTPHPDAASRFLVEHGIAKPGSEVAEKGLLGTIESIPSDVIEYFRKTPSALEQEAKIREQIAGINADEEASLGRPLTPGEKAFGASPEAREKIAALRNQSPIAGGFTPGEGIIGGAKAMQGAVHGLEDIAAGRTPTPEPPPAGAPPSEPVATPTEPTGAAPQHEPAFDIDSGSFGVRGPEGDLVSTGHNTAEEAAAEAERRNAPAPEEAPIEEPEWSKNGLDDWVSPEHPAAPDIATAAEATHAEPTEAQIEAGNYPKGRFNYEGMGFTIETPQGAMRRGTGPNGPWENESPAHYGYIRRTEGADGEQIDSYMGPHPESDKAFVVDQIDPDTGDFDEHKVIFGARTPDEATAIYDAGFSDGRGPERRGAVTQMSVPEFKNWLANGDTTEPVSYDPERAAIQAEATGGLREGNAPFYSALTRAAETLPQAKGTGDQFLAMLKKAGVKPEELEWTGTEDFLKGKSSVAKQELLDHVRANEVNIREVEKGGEEAQRQIALENAEKALVDHLVDNEHFPANGARDYALRAAQGDLSPGQLRLQSAATRDLVQSLLEAYEARQTGDYGKRTKFDSYVLPGGENYRELLLTLPNAEAERLDARRQEIEGLGASATPEQRQEWADIMNRLRPDNRDVEGISRFRGFPYFRSSHFDEPNILAHVRFNDRTGPNGEKLLHIEEIQSDWHQKGRRHGYKLPADEGARLDARRQELESLGHNATPEQKQEWADIMNRLQPENGFRVPNAPLKKTWPETAFRRMVRYAAENGYDGVTWTTGEQQAARYDLSKHISRVEFSRHSGGIGKGPEELGSGMLRAYDHSGKRVINEHVEPDQIADYVGKDVAEKLLTQRGVHHNEGGLGAYTRELKGLDLKVGGEGMKGFYDRILPQYADKFGKKFGAKVGETEISTKPTADDISTEGEGPTEKVHYFPITDAMREAVNREGVALFQGEGGSSPHPTRDISPDFADYARGSDDPMSLNNTARRYVIERGRENGNEHLVAYDANGHVVSHALTQDHPNMVNFSPGLDRATLNPDANFILHHNHPTDVAISEADVGMLARPGIKWIIAHGHDGEMSAVRLHPAFVEATKNLPIGQLQRALGYLYGAARDQIVEHLSGAVRTQQISFPIARGYQSELINRALASAGTTDYIGTRSFAHLPQSVIDRALADADRAVRDTAERLGYPIEEKPGGNAYRPAVILRPDSGIAEILKRDGETPGRPTGPVGGEGVRGGGEESTYRPEGTPPPGRPGLREDNEEHPVDTFLSAVGPEGTLEPGTAPGRAPEQRIEAGSGDQHLDNTAHQIADSIGGKGTGSNETRKLREFAQKANAQVKNLNPVERYTIFPRVLATLDDMSAKFWNAWQGRLTEAQSNVESLRKTISNTFLKLPKESRERVYAALELGRTFDWRPEDNGQSIEVRNKGTWWARKSKPGDRFTLTPEETKAFHELARLGDEQWDMRMRAVAKSYGWDGPLDVNAIAQAAKESPENRKPYGRLVDLLMLMQKQKRTTYFPAMRYGDHFVSVTPKAGVDKESLGGFPEVKWFELVQRPALDDLLGRSQTPGELNGRLKDKIAEIRALRKGDGSQAFPESQYTIETGDLVRRPDILRRLNIPAVEKLMMLMDSKVRKEIAERSLRDDPEMGGGEAKAQAAADYKRMHRDLLDAFRDQMYEELRAGFARQAKLTPGYSADFDRAIGDHMRHIANTSADLVHRDPIEAAYTDLQDNHPHHSVKQYWKTWRTYQEDPAAPLSRAANLASQVGFSYTLAANPSSTLIIALHTPMAAAPTMGAGAGMARAGGALSKALSETYRNLGFDRNRGAHINLENLGRTPDEKAFLAKMGQEGRLHSLGAHDMEALTDRQANAWGNLASTMSKAFRIASSNISVVDQANRSAVGLAAYRMARDPRVLAQMAKPLMEHNAVFRDMVAKDGLTPETMGRFMLSDAAFEWGKANRSPIMRGPMGALLFTLHGFQTRYLSTAWKLMNNMGPEGKIAAAWMMGTLWAGAGVDGLPFTQDMQNAADHLWKYLTKRDPMINYRIRQFLVSSGFGKIGAEMIMRGPIGTLSGVDLSSRIGFGDIVSRELSGSSAAVLGTVPSIVFSRLNAAWTRHQSGQGVGADLTELLPSGMRSPARAAVEASQGVRTQKGRITTPAQRVTAGDIVKQGLGFRPLSQERQYERNDYNYRAKRAKGPVPRNPIPAPNE